MSSPERKRVFILGAGFSKAAKMPDACKLTCDLRRATVLRSDNDFYRWFEHLKKRINRINGASGSNDDIRINVEQLFDFALYHRELLLMRREAESSLHRGPGSADHDANLIQYWLTTLESELRSLLVNEQNGATLAEIAPFISSLNDKDKILSFNYDTLAEKCLSDTGKLWWHGFTAERTTGVTILKLHGSIDWWLKPKISKKEDIERLIGETPPDPADWEELELLYEAPGEDKASWREDSSVHLKAKPLFDLWRDKKFGFAPEPAQTLEQVKDLDRSVLGLEGLPRPGLAGLGPHKPLHELAGSAVVWTNAFKALKEADEIYVIGWSASPYDMMARFHFASVLGLREKPLDRVVVVDPNVHKQIDNYRTIFGDKIIAVPYGVEEADWPAPLAI